MIHFDPTTHTYTVNGEVYPSVTQIIQGAGLIDTTWFTDYGRDRGTMVHRVIQYHLAGELDETSIDPVLWPYFVAFRKFEAESGLDVEASELQLANSTYRFAGTLDLKGLLHHRQVIIDIKTGANNPATGIQLAGYEFLVGEKCLRYALQLSDDETYKLHPFTDRTDRDVFLAALTLYRWKQNNIRRGE
jgi:hypothetical protein